MLDARPSRLLLRGQSIASLIFFETSCGFCSVLPTGHLHWAVLPPTLRLTYARNISAMAGLPAAGQCYARAGRRVRQ